MWIEQTKSGKYKYVEQYTDYLTGKKKRVSVTLEKNTSSAKKVAMETLTRLIDERQSKPIETNVITFQMLVDKYRAYQERTVKPSTYKRNYFAQESLLKILGPDTIVDRFTANYIKEQFLSTGRQPSTLNEFRTRLLALLRWGYENDYINDISYLGKVKPFKEEMTRKERIQDKFLEASEVCSLLSAMKVEKWKLLTRFLVLSGLRSGEAFALTKSDIDFKEHVIRVTKTYDRNNRIVTTTKTLTSTRDIFMQEELEKVTRALLLHTKIDGLEHNYRSDLMLCNRKGEHANYYSYNKYLRETSMKVLNRPVTAHTLRHTHASLLLAQGVDIETITRRLGHENSKITREIYIHVTQGLKERDNEQIRRACII